MLCIFQMAIIFCRAWVGLTASTGVAQQTHYVHSFSFEDGTCRQNCNDRGQCVDAQCHCEVRTCVPTLARDTKSCVYVWVFVWTNIYIYKHTHHIHATAQSFFSCVLSCMNMDNISIVIVYVHIYAWTAGGLLRRRLCTGGDSTDTSWSELVSWLRHRTGTCIQRVRKLFMPSRYVPGNFDVCVCVVYMICAVACSEEIIRIFVKPIYPLNRAA